MARLGQFLRIVGHALQKWGTSASFKNQEHHDWTKRGGGEKIGTDAGFWLPTTQ